MAVFIKRERLGSNARPPVTYKRPDTFRLLKSEFAGGITLGEKIAQVEGRKAENRERLREEYESNAEVQHHRTLTPEEKMRTGMDACMEGAKAVVSMRKGSEATHEETHRYVEGLANKLDAKAKDGD